MPVELRNLGCVGIPMTSVKEPWKIADRVKHVGDMFYAYLYEGRPLDPRYIYKQFYDENNIPDGTYDLPLDETWRIPE